jgi:DNA-binding transcriptional regulator LsrR (DeoR family)
MSTDEAERIGAIRAATMCRRFYLDGRSKREIAEEFGISRFKVARILDDARASGLVEIKIKSPPGVDVALSDQLQQSYGLHQAVVVDVPIAGESNLRHELGSAAAQLIREAISERDVLGIGWGRTLDAVTLQLTELPACTVVQMAGVVGPLNDNALELVRRISLASGGRSYPLYAPLLLSDPETALAVKAHGQVAAVLRRFADITVAIVAVGSWSPPNSQLRASLSPSEQNRLLRVGVRAEICSTLIDADGLQVASEFSEKSISITAAQLKKVPEIIGVAGGVEKAAAIRAAVKGGFLTSLVTDRAAADWLLATGIS